MLPLWFVASLASCLLFHLWSQESAHFRGSLFSLAEVEKGQFNLVQMCCCAFWCFFWLIELFIFDIFCWVIAAKSTPTVMSWCINSSDCTSIIIYLPKTVVSPLSPHYPCSVCWIAISVGDSTTLPRLQVLGRYRHQRGVRAPGSLAFTRVMDSPYVGKKNANIMGILAFIYYMYICNILIYIYILYYVLICNIMPIGHTSEIWEYHVGTFGITHIYIYIHNI